MPPDDQLEKRKAAREMQQKELRAMIQAQRANYKSPDKNNNNHPLLHHHSEFQFEIIEPAVKIRPPLHIDDLTVEDTSSV